MKNLYSSLEPLESRIAPAVIMTVGDFDGDGIAHDLKLKGGSGKERIEILDSSTGTSLAIDANGDGDFTDPKDQVSTPIGFAVQQFDINLGAGNDIVTISMTATYSTAKSFLINLGSGNNEFHFLAGSNNMNAGGPVRFDITGGSGNDYLEMQFRNISTTVEINTQLGGGTDGRMVANKIVGPSTLLFNGIYGGGRVNANLDLGTGSNQFLTTFDSSSGVFGVAAPFDLRFIGSNVATQKDDITVRLDGINLDTGSQIRVSANLGAGNDAFHAQFKDSFRFANSLMTEAHPFFAFDVDGGAGNDLIEAVRIGTSAIFQLDGLLDINFRGGTGNDTLKLDLGSALATSQLTTTDATSKVRTLRLRLDGGAGNDVLSASVSNTTAASFDYDLALFGAAGNDQITFNGANNGGTVTYGGAIAAVLDGGFGIDKIGAIVAGGFAVKIYNREMVI